MWLSPILVFTTCQQVWKGVDRFIYLILETLNNKLIALDTLSTSKQGKKTYSKSSKFLTKGLINTVKNIYIYI